MNSLDKFNLIKIKKFLRETSRRAAQHLFLTFMILIFIAAILGLAVFYKYGILPQKSDPELGGELIRFDENIYQKVLKEWQSRQERFEAAKTKKYPNPFK